MEARDRNGTVNIYDNSVHAKVRKQAKSRSEQAEQFGDGTRVDGQCQRS